MNSDWNSYWRELDEVLDKPENQRHEAIKRLAEDLALAIHKRQMQILERLPGGASDEH
jgi:hypothetical protein